jgi:hypothetical protein
MALHAALAGFEHGKHEASLVRAGFVHGNHVPVAAVRFVDRQLRQPVGDRPLLEERVAERDRRRFVRRRTGGTDQRREIRESGTVRNQNGTRQQQAAGSQCSGAST